MGVKRQIDSRHYNLKPFEVTSLGPVKERRIDRRRRFLRDWIIRSELKMAATVEGFFNTFNTKLEAPVRTHLKNVYASLAMSVLSAAAGAYVDVNVARLGGLATSLLGLALASALYFTADNGKNRLQRLALLLGFAFTSGISMGPLLDLAVRIDP